MYGQFRKRYTQTTKEQRLYAVKEIIGNGRVRKEVADELNVSVNSINSWIRKYKKKGEITTPSFSLDEIKRLKEIEKKYNEQLKEIRTAKKVQCISAT